MIETGDGSFTLYSHEYDECYHSVKEGAFSESLMKYVEPAFDMCTKDNILILDICFGLGYNTLATIWYFKKQTKVKSMEIFSPELDTELVASLLSFEYPKELNQYKHILKSLMLDGKYEENGISVSLFIGDALAYVPTLTSIDVVYQDAFSPTKNPFLWSIEYFQSIYKILNDEGVVFSYSIARLVQENLKNAKFEVEKFKMKNKRHMLIGRKKKRG